MSGTINLGRVRPIYKGNYNAETAYSVLERVKYKGHIYECVANTIPGIAPDSADNGSAYWIQISVNNAIPQPVWTGTELAFEYPDGTITDAVDLIGSQGPQGVPGPVNLTSDLTSTAADVALTALGGNTLATRIALLQTRAEQGLGFNTKEIIEESGEWEAPFTGVYRITVINGGDGGFVSSTGNDLIGGKGGARETKFISLSKGQKVPVTIGAGGIGLLLGEYSGFSTTVGGLTYFGDFTPNEHMYWLGTRIYVNNWSTSIYYARAEGGGLGGGIGHGDNLIAINGQYYGAGGGAFKSSSNSIPDAVGNGFQGCVIAEYFDPEKAPLPTINDTDLITYINLLQRLEAIESQLNINS